MDWINNTWATGIGTGILSGLLVAWITRKVFSRKDEREIARSIESANREVLLAVRSEVSEEQVPSIDVVEALINASARKYKVETRYLLKPRQIAEELIKEVMDSSFISSRTKRLFCDNLKSLIPSAETALDKQVQKEAQVFVARVEYRERMVMLFSMILGMITAMGSLYVAIRPRVTSSIGGAVFESLMPMALILFVVVVLMNVMVSIMKMRHKRLREEMGIIREKEAH